MAAADRIAGDHGDDRLRQPPDLDLKVQHVQPRDAAVIDVPVLGTDPLVAPGTERLRPFPGQDDHADRRVVAGDVERLRQLEEGLRAERVANLRPVDRDLRDALGGFVPDVLVVAGPLPIHQTVHS